MKYFIESLFIVILLSALVKIDIFADNLQSLQKWYLEELQDTKTLSETKTEDETNVTETIVEEQNDKNQTSISVSAEEKTLTADVNITLPENKTVPMPETEEIVSSIEHDQNITALIGKDNNITKPIVIVKYYGDDSSQELCNSLSKEYIDFWNLLDLTLINATAIILKKHDIKISEENMEIIRSEYYPNLSIGYAGEYYHGFARTAQTGVGGRFYPSTSDFRDSLSLNLNHELYHFGATDLKVEMGEKDIEIVKSELALQAEDISRRLLEYYTTALKAQNFINFKKKIEDILNRILEKKVRLYEMGQVAKIVLTKDKLSIVSLQKELSQQKMSYLRAIKNIEMLANISIDTNRSKFAMLEPKNSKIKTFEESAGAKYLKLQIEKKLKELALVRKEYLPTVYASGDYVMLGSDKALLEAIKGLQKNNWDVGLNIKWDLFNGYKTNKTIDKIKYELRKLAEKYRLARIEFESKEEQRKMLQQSIEKVLKVESELYEQTCQQGEIMAKLKGAGLVDDLQLDYIEINKIQSELEFRMGVIDKVYQTISSELIQ